MLKTGGLNIIFVEIVKKNILDPWINRNIKRMPFIWNVSIFLFN